MTKFIMYKGDDKEHYFRVVTGKGDVLLASNGFSLKSDCIDGINAVKANAPMLMNYVVKTSTTGKHYFTLKTEKGSVIGKSVPFSDYDILKQKIQTLRTNAGMATVEDADMRF